MEMIEFWYLYHWNLFPVASFTKEANPRLAKRPLKTNGRLANRELTSLVKEATVRSPINNELALVQVLGWRRTGDKSLPEPMLAQFTDTYRWHAKEMG